METVIDRNIRSLIGAGNLRERMRAETRRIPLRAMTRIVSRNSAIEAAWQLLTEKAWPAMTMAEVASLAGISRQTLYKEFGSRDGLAEAYVLRFLDGFLFLIREETDAHPDDPRAAIRMGFGRFLSLAFADPLVQRGIEDSDQQAQLLRLLTTDGGKIYRHATDGLTEIFTTAWEDIDHESARIAADGLVRLAISNIELRSGSPESIATDLAHLFAPYIEAALAGSAESDDGIAAGD